MTIAALEQCEECGGCYGAHRGGCLQGNTDGRGWLTCDCGNKIYLLPIREYHGEDWGGCHVHHLCEKCPLHNSEVLLNKVKEVFGP